MADKIKQTLKKIRKYAEENLTIENGFDNCRVEIIYTPVVKWENVQSYNIDNIIKELKEKNNEK